MIFEECVFSSYMKKKVLKFKKMKVKSHKG